MTMDRRHFLKKTALWSAGTAISPLLTIHPELFAKTDATPEIFVAIGKDYARTTRLVIQGAGGMASFVKKGDKVVIKPNIGWDRTVELAANTHPVVVAELARLAAAAGASRVMVFDRPCNEERRCYQNSGIQPALEALDNRRIQCEFIDRRKFVDIALKKGKKIDRWSFYRDALEADCYINVPVAKHHGLSELSLGMKNVMGVIGGRRGSLHWDLAQNLADLNTVVRPSLTVVDATRVLTRNGPQGGMLSDVKIMDTMIASTDPVAADAYATTLFNKEPSAIASTVAAHEMGLGQMNLDRCRIETLLS